MKNFQNAPKTSAFSESSRKWLRIGLYSALFYLGVRYALPLLAPFLTGLSIAALVQKPAAILSERIPALSRKGCCVIMTAAVILMITAAVWFAFCSVMDGAMSFCPGIPARLEKIRLAVSRVSGCPDGASAWRKFTSLAASGADRCMDFLADNYRDYLPQLVGRSTRMIAVLPSLLAAAVFTLLSALFACGDFQGIKDTVRQLLPGEITRAASLVIHTSVATLTLLAKTYGVILLITFAELAAGLGMIALTGHGTGNVITISLIIAIIDILPGLGTGTVLIPWGIYRLITGEIASGVMLLVLSAVIEAVRSVLEPKLIAGRLELHPFFTLAGVYVGGKLFGAAGILIMPLAMIILRRILSQKNGAAESTVHDTG